MLAPPSGCAERAIAGVVSRTGTCAAGLLGGASCAIAGVTAVVAVSNTPTALQRATSEFVRAFEVMGNPIEGYVGSIIM
jgi:phage-related minor tail protein